MALSPTLPTADGVSREDLPTQSLPSIKDLLEHSYPTIFQSVPANGLFHKPSLPSPSVSCASDHFIANSCSSEQILQFDVSKAKISPCQHNISAGTYVTQQARPSFLPVDLAPQICCHPPINSTQSSAGLKVRNMASLKSPAPPNPCRSVEGNPNLAHMHMSLNKVRGSCFIPACN